jgi:NADPH:quinone reductase-like Zn-dependent oxidoreductase
LEFAGEVESVGSDVRAWKVGQRVFGITGGGAQAEFVVTPENQLAEIPSNLDWTNAAAVPEVFITAHDALYTQAKLQRGEALLIHAVASGVGTAALQLAHASGATVFGTSRSADKLAACADLGLDQSLVVEGDPGAIATAVDQWTKGKGANVILDLVGSRYLQTNLDALAPKGKLIFVGTTSGSKAELDFSLVMRKRATIIGTVLRARSSEEKAAATRLFADQVLPLLKSEAVKPIIDRVYDLKDVRNAHLRLESNESLGKVVLRFD